VQRTQKTTQQQPAAASKLIDSVNECNSLFNKNLYVKQKIANNKHVIEEVSYHRVIIVASYN
jgi:hypothetical protein